EPASSYTHLWECDIPAAEPLKHCLVRLRQTSKFEARPFPFSPSDFGLRYLPFRSPILRVDLQREVMAQRERRDQSPFTPRLGDIRHHRVSEPVLGLDRCREAHCSSGAPPEIIGFSRTIVWEWH